MQKIKYEIKDGWCITACKSRSFIKVGSLACTEQCYNCVKHDEINKVVTCKHPNN